MHRERHQALIKSGLAEKTVWMFIDQLKNTRAALLDVARLRAECVRTGIREVNVGKGPGFGKPAYVVRLSPVELKVSQEVRLGRLVKDSVYKDIPRAFHHVPLDNPEATSAEIIKFVEERKIGPQ